MPELRAHAASIPVIGDRRTAALVASDGTVDWLCLPDYDGDTVFGALLDAHHGGFWRIGPDRRISGRQRYHGDTFALQTRWSLPEGEVELTDIMLRPENDRAPELNDARTFVRCVRGRKGRVRCRFDFVPTRDFRVRLPFERTNENEIVVTGAPAPLRLWLSRSLPFENGQAQVEFDLAAGDEVWAVLESGAPEESWSIARASKLASAARRYWRTEERKVCYTGPRRRQIVRSVQLVHLLSYAPQGSLIAAPTTSLPEGTWTADYRFAWVRDASLSLAILAMLGLTGEAQRYMDWLITLRSSNDAPLQVLYGIRGELDLTPRERTDVSG